MAEPPETTSPRVPCGRRRSPWQRRRPHGLERPVMAAGGAAGQGAGIGDGGQQGRGRLLASSFVFYLLPSVCFLKPDREPQPTRLIKQNQSSNFKFNLSLFGLNTIWPESVNSAKSI